MKRIVGSLILIVLLLLNNSCSEGINDPLPGRRDYVWVSDTIRIPMSTLFHMWGSSDTDIWAVGQGGGLDQTIWHFNGNNWATDGVSRRISPTSIFGFASDDIWLGGNSGMIWHYNGSAWEESLSLTPVSKWGYSRFYCLFGNSSSDLYAAGFVDSSKVPQEEIGVIFHFNGITWEQLKIEMKGLHFVSMTKSPQDENYYLLASTINDDWTNSAILFSFDGNDLTEIKRTKFNDYSGANLGLIGDRVYFGIDDGVYTYDGSNFNLQFKVDIPNFTQGIAGRNNHDIFLSMWDGITHYNGTDIEYVIKDSSLNYRDILVFENKLFILCTTMDGLTIIKRGTLNDK